jgi:hypothetical protein
MAVQEQWQSILAWDPMNIEAITLVGEQDSIRAIRGKNDCRVAPLESVAGALGYTEKEMDLAGGVLNRFAWRRRG